MIEWPLRMRPHHVFLSYNTADQFFVEMLQRHLQEEGLSSWYDASVARPGESWVSQIEQALQHIPVVLVCLGAHGLGVYQSREVQLALSLHVQGPGRLVIPVLLPNAPADVQVPGFLSVHSWVDLRRHFARRLEVLCKAIRSGQAPAPEAPGGLKDCPYRGLKAFGERDAEQFFGRQAQVAELQQQLDSVRLVTLVGASGSGKSSLVFAGLLPSVRKSGLAGCSSWSVLSLRPGPRPCHELAVRLMQAQGRDDPQQLKQLKAGLLASADTLSLTVDLWPRGPEPSRVLLVVDQLEELFTQVEQEAEREAFLAALLHAATVPGGHVSVVCTLRADFMARGLEHPLLSSVMGTTHLFMLRPMGKAELREAIVRPALMSGASFEDGLVDTLVDEVHGQPGDLPLLQFTLENLWQARTDTLLTWEAYRKLGGLKGAITLRAESLLGGWDEAQRGTARRLFGRLVQLGEHAEDTRRRASLAELQGVDPGRAPRILSELIGERLLTATDEQVEVAHEALIREWKTLKEWLLEDRDDLRLRQELGRELAQWKQGGRRADDLLHGSLLQRAVALKARRSIPLSKEEEQFVEASEEDRARREAQQVEHTRKLARNNRYLSVAVGVALLLLVAAFSGWTIARKRLKSSLGLAEALTSKIDRTLQPVVGSEPVRKDMLDEVIVLLEQMGTGETDPAMLRLRLFSHQQRAPLQSLKSERQKDLLNALNAVTQLLADRPLDVELLEKQADLYYHLGREALTHGAPNEANEWFEKYVPSARRVVAARPEAFAQYQQLNHALSVLGWNAVRLEHPMRSAELHYQALAVLQTAPRPQAPDPQSQFLLSQSYMELGRLQESWGSLDSAETFYTWALHVLDNNNPYADVLRPTLLELLAHVSMLQHRMSQTLLYFQRMDRLAQALLLQKEGLDEKLVSLLSHHYGVLGSLSFPSEEEQQLQAFYDQEELQLETVKGEALTFFDLSPCEGYLALGELAKRGGREEEGQQFQAKAIAHLDVLLQKAKKDKWPLRVVLLLSDALIRSMDKKLPGLQELLDRNIDIIQELHERRPGDKEVDERFIKLLTLSGERHAAENKPELAWLLYDHAIGISLEWRKKGDRSLLNDLRIVSNLRRMAVLVEEWQPERSQEFYVKALTECEKALERHSSYGPLWRELGFLHERMARREPSQESREELRVHWEKSVEGYAHAVEKEPDSVESRFRLAKAEIKLGDFWLSGSKADTPTTAEAHYRKALELLSVLIQETPSDQDTQNRLCHVYNRLGVLAQARGEDTFAQSYFEEDLKMSKRLAAGHPESPSFQRDLTVAYSFLARLARKRQHLEEARVFLEESLKTLRALAQRFPRDVPIRVDLLNVQNEWCDFLKETRNPALSAECSP